MKILVDSSVLLDVFTQDPQWLGGPKKSWPFTPSRSPGHQWIIYAEVSVHFSTQEELEQVLSPMAFERLLLTEYGLSGGEMLLRIGAGRPDGAPEISNRRGCRNA